MILGDELFQWVVDEVIKRVKCLLNTHRCLIVIKENTDYEMLNLLLLSMQQKGFIFDLYVDAEDHVKAQLNQQIEMTKVNAPKLDKLAEFVQPYEIVIISNMNMIELSKLIQLNIDSPLIYLIYQVIKDGKSVYGFSNDLEIINNRKLQHKIQTIIAALEEMGIKMIQKKVSATRQEHHVISLEHVKNLNHSSLIIRPDAILTNAAKEYLSKNQIEVIRK